ncbi:MAG TPA: phage holin family protein [Nocardioidaceae bacterium]|nr:phage holin family protein [Nocardioidaceae bacterium]
MTHRETPATEDASLGQLTGDLSQQVSRLVRDEIRLAQVEMKDKGRRFGKGAGLMGAGGVIALFGVGCVVAAAVLALDLAWPTWLAAIVVGAVLLIVAAIVAATGRSQMRRGTPPMPRQAMESTKEDIEALKGGHR